MTTNLFTARGEGAKESLNKKKVDLKEAYLRMKSGDSVTVRVLGVTDYVEYISHSSFTHKIYTQPCVEVIGKECALCVASKSGLEGYETLLPRKRYLFVFAEVNSGTLKALEVSKNQAKKIIADIEEYSDSINDLPFNLKKSGEGTNTGYSLLPVIKKLTPEDKEKFEKAGELEVTDEYFNAILTPRTIELQVKTLKESGFPTSEYFPHIKIEEEETTAPAEKGAVEKTEITDGDLPF